MPGRRNYARERLAHARLAPELERQYAALLTRHDIALIGRSHILAFLHRLGLRRLNGGPLTWPIVLAWRRDHGFPLLRGNRNAQRRSPPLTTTAIVTAWTLARFEAHPCFSLAKQAELAHQGSFPKTHAA